jgi:hypothetical protein
MYVLAARDLSYLLSFYLRLGLMVYFLIFLIRLRIAFRYVLACSFFSILHREYVGGIFTKKKN